MNFLFINDSLRLFADSDTGASVRSTLLIKALARLGHVDVVTFGGPTVPNIPDCDVAFGQKMTNTADGKENRLRKFLKLFCFRNVNVLFPIIPEKEVVIEEQLAKKRYDYIACRSFNDAAFLGLLKHSGKLILDLDDNPIEQVRLKALFTRTLGNRIYHWLLSLTTALLAKNCLKNVFCCFHSNISQPCCNNSIYLPNVALNTSACPDVNEKLSKRIIMVGNYEYSPNSIGASHFIDEIFPMIKRFVPDAEFHIVGKISDDADRQRWDSVEGVSVVGYVQDLMEEYAQARCVIVPLYHGSGTSVKVIEAMQFNRPCVITPKGIRGLDGWLRAGKDYMPGNTDEEFAKGCISLLDDPVKGKELARNASLQMERYFSQTHFFEVVAKGVLKS